MSFVSWSSKELQQCLQGTEALLLGQFKLQVNVTQQVQVASVHDAAFYANAYLELSRLMRRMLKDVLACSKGLLRLPELQQYSLCLLLSIGYLYNENYELRRRPTCRSMQEQPQRGLILVPHRELVTGPLQHLLYVIHTRCSYYSWGLKPARGRSTGSMKRVDSSLSSFAVVVLSGQGKELEQYCLDLY